MSKLTSKKLRQLILKEFEKIEEEQLLKRYKGPGIDRFAAAHRTAAHTSCHECGYGMKEGDSVCEQCGSMYEVELNEGGCGSAPEYQATSTCGGDGVIDHDLDNDFIPDQMSRHDMTESDVENLILNAITADLHSHDTNASHSASIFNLDHSSKKHHGGAYMAKKQMYKVAKYAEKLYHMIPDGHNLEDWMRSKLAQIADDIGEVYHALDHDKFEGDI